MKNSSIHLGAVQGKRKRRAQPDLDCLASSPLFPCPRAQGLSSHHCREHILLMLRSSRTERANGGCVRVEENGEPSPPPPATTLPLLPPPSRVQGTRTVAVKTSFVCFGAVKQKAQTEFACESKRTQSAGVASHTS